MCVCVISLYLSHGLELVDALLGVALSNLLESLVFVAALLQIVLMGQVLFGDLVRVLGLVEIASQLFQLLFHVLVLVHGRCHVLFGL